MYKKKIMITFGSHSNYINAGNRLIQQCRENTIFDRHILYTSNSLKEDNTFWSQHHKFILANPRGYGYWLWKPYIILKTMREMKDGDVLLYLDCGCEMDSRKSPLLRQMIKMVETESLIGTYTGHDDTRYTKYDLINLITPPMNTMTHAQHQAGALLWLVCPKTRKLVNEWYDLCCDYHNIDDSPSILPNPINFIEHRHDQSVFSLLTKKYNLFSRYILNNCIDYIRNRTGESKMPKRRTVSLTLTR
jgi:hypothetical protein